MKKMLLLALAGVMASHLQAQNAINLGGDISMLPQYESANTPYYRSNGAKINDVLDYMKTNCKMNAMRVRLFVEPDNTTDITLVQDLDYVTQLGKRIKDKGMDFMLSIHYSDTWADPSHQDIPKSWTKNTATDALKDSVYNYTLRCLTHLKDNGATPDFVQIGNEVSYGMLWRNNNDRCYSNASNSTWKRFTDFLSAGAKAVREATPNAKIILHIERSGDPSASTSFFTKMKANNVDYDIIGLSYYPFWHKSLATLSNTLNDLATSFPDKPVQIVETAYYYKWFPTNDSDYDDTTGTWPATPAGQKQFIEDLCNELAKHDNVTGLYYWFPEENGSGATKTVQKPWINRGLWDNETHKINSGILSLQNFLTSKEALGIEQPKAESSQLSTLNYQRSTLSGQSVTSTPLPGIYVKKGKKIYIKN